MSQRLHIGDTKEEFYDCVIASLDGAKEKLCSEWLEMSHGHYLGPWKVRIGDKNLYLELESTIEALFASLGEEYPDAVWTFYDGERTLNHPTRDELRAWLSPPNAEARDGGLKPSENTEGATRRSLS